MKKLTAVISAAVLCGALLSGCAGEDEDKMQILSPGLLPEGYTMEQAEEDGCFLVKDKFAADAEDLLSGQASWNRFLECAQTGIPSFVRIIFCQTDEEGEPYFNSYGVFDLIYDGTCYTIYYNDGEWTMAGTDLYGRQYDYLLALEGVDQSGGAYTHMVLTDNGDATLEDYLLYKSLGSPSGYDPEDIWLYDHLITFYTPAAEG